MREVTERPVVSHFRVVTDRRVLVFWIAPKKFTGGLANGPALCHQTAWDAVCVSDFAKKFGNTRIRLEFAEGAMPFEAGTNSRDIVAMIAAVLPPCPPRP
jgi:hypothetical protein